MTRSQEGYREEPGGRPALAVVFGHFSTVAEMSDWQGLEAFLNPGGVFARVHVLALGDDHEYPGFEFGNVRVHRVSTPLPHAFRSLNATLIMMLGCFHLWRLVRREGIDIVAQVDSTPLKYGFPAVFVARRLGLPSVITLQSDYYQAAKHARSPIVRWAGNVLWPYVLSGATRIRAVSRTVAQFALDHGVPPDRVRIIPNKVDLERFRSPTPSEKLGATLRDLGIETLIAESVVFLTVARLIEIKNLERCLRAFADASRGDPRLAYLIAGEGPLLDELTTLARELGVDGRVRFLGYFAHERLAQLYHASDVFLFPTLYEGNPRAVLEALAAGLPVISSDAGAVTELVGAEDGILVEPTDQDQIQRAISRLAQDADLRARLGRHPAFEVNRFTIEGVNELEGELYRELLDGTERLEKRALAS